MNFCVNTIPGFLLLLFGTLTQAGELRHCASHAIWSHAAYRSESGQTPLSAIRAKIDEGFCGIEIDIIYDDLLKMFYVAHDPVSEDNEKNRRRLSDVAEMMSEQKVHIWLDWKNVSVLNAKAGLSILKENFRGYLQRDNYLIVETSTISAAMYMDFLGFRHIRVLYWLGYGGSSKSLRDRFRDIRTFALYCYTNAWVSTPSLGLIDACQRRRGRLFIFTLDNTNAIESFLNKGASVILTDLSFRELREQSLQ